MPTLPDYIRGVGFDWDGTLVDTMPDKAYSFAATLMQYYPELAHHQSQSKLAKLFLDNRGITRKEHLSVVCKEFHLNPLTANECSQEG